MKEHEMEGLLENICQEHVEPPRQLVLNTRKMLKRRRTPFLNLVVFLALLFTALVFFATIMVFILPGLGWLYRALWFCGISTFFNGLLVLILLNREKVTGFFHEFAATFNHQPSPAA